MARPGIGICSWCIDRHDVVAAVRHARARLGVDAMQVGFFGADAVERADCEAIRETAEAEDVSLVGTFIGFDGEEYTSIERIAETGGFTPDEAYPARLALTRKVGALSAELGCLHLAVHPATIPADATSPLYAMLVKRVGDVADAVAESGVRLLLETGREPVGTLVRFIDDVGRENVGVNFDPANLVVYGTDDPVRAVAELGDLIEIVHVKDARRSSRPGLDFGQAAAIGQGDVEIRRVLDELGAIDFMGPVLLEVKSLPGDPHGVRKALVLVRSMLE